MNFTTNNKVADIDNAFKSNQIDEVVMAGYKLHDAEIGKMITGAISRVIDMVSGNNYSIQKPVGSSVSAVS